MEKEKPQWISKMGKNRPIKRTPFCGKPGCEWPEQIVNDHPNHSCYDCSTCGHFIGIGRFEGKEFIISQSETKIRQHLFALFNFCPSCGKRLI